MRKERMSAIALTGLLTILVIGLMPLNASAVEGENTYTVDIWVTDTSGVGLNNATVELRQATDKMGGELVQTGITDDYIATVDNETIGTGDGTETVFTVTGTPVKDWNGDDNVDDNDILVYVDGTKQAITAYDLAKNTGTVTFAAAPTNGKKITATYKWNAGNGHVQFTDVPADTYVIKAKKTSYITEYKTVSVAGDSVYTVELSKYSELGHAFLKGNPIVLIGAGITAVGALVAVAAKMH